MVMEEPPEINPPSGRVPGQELLLIPILESRWRRNSGIDHKKESFPRDFGKGCKYRPKGAPGVAPPVQAARGCGLLGASWGRLERGWSPSGSPSGFRSLPVYWNFGKFSGFF